MFSSFEETFGDLADLSQDELIEWLTVVKTLETALQSAFEATMINLARLVDGYQQ